MPLSLRAKLPAGDQAVILIRGKKTAGHERPGRPRRPRAARRSIEARSCTGNADKSAPAAGSTAAQRTPGARHAPGSGSGPIRAKVTADDPRLGKHSGALGGGAGGQRGRALLANHLPTWRQNPPRRPSPPAPGGLAVRRPSATNSCSNRPPPWKHAYRCTMHEAHDSLSVSSSVQQLCLLLLACVTDWVAPELLCAVTCSLQSRGPLRPYPR